MKISRTFRHPFVLLISATILSPFIIPLIEQKSRLHEARLEKALQIVERGTEVDRHLNNLQTTLEIFHKDSSGVAARLVDFSEEQKELRKVMMARYLEFDMIAWWWYRNMATEAVLLELKSPAELERITELIGTYEANVVESTSVISDLWNTFLRQEYDPKDAQNTVAMERTRAKLKELEKARGELISDLTRMLVAD